MLSERGRRALLDMLENASAAQDFVQGLTVEAFTADRRTLYAVIRCLEIISEASRRVDVVTVERHPHVPWRQMADAGNVYRHRYDPGFKRSSQQLCAPISAARQRPRPVFSSPGFCVAGH